MLVRPILAKQTRLSDLLQGLHPYEWLTHLAVELILNDCSSFVNDFIDNQVTQQQTIHPMANHLY